jgi:shikimate kinase
VQWRTGDPRSTLERLGKERRKAYELAHLHIKSGSGAHREVVEAIVRALDSHLKGAA